MTNLLDHVNQFIRTQKLLARRQGILVAVSGGLDSMTLLNVLYNLAASHGWKLTVAHLNHQLRGRSSDGDERFVRAACARLELPCVVERAGVRAHAKERGLSIEMAARELRHEFLARTAKRFRLPTIAVAHHADDQVELFFLRLLRGAGGEGLGGMKRRSLSPADPAIQLVRPLLNAGRADLEHFARENRIRFREDASNAAPDVLRNRIRRELLPLLRHRFQPALSQTVLRTMDIVGAEAETVTEAARAWLMLKTRSLSGCPVALQRRIIQLQLRRANLKADYELVESLRLHPRKKICVGPGVVIERMPSGRLHQVASSVAGGFNSTQSTVALKRGTGTHCFGGLHFRWQLAASRTATRPVPKPGREFFDAHRVGYNIVLRHWRPGDRFQPMGMTTTVKLQDWFTNQKIPRGRRHKLVVGTTESGEIFWIENQRISERFKLTSRTKDRLIWQWKRRKSRVAVARQAC